MLGNLGVLRFRATEAEAAPVSAPDLPFEPAGAGVPVTASSLEECAGADARAEGFRFETVNDFHHAYLDKKATPTDVAERLLANLEESEQSDPAMRLFVASYREDVMRQAEESTKRYSEGRCLSVLDGVPVPVKDEIDVRGYPTTVGTRFLGAVAAKADAHAVEQLRAAGAIVPGKTNMHELGIGVTGINPHHGTARNPYDPSCFTGGSSSGSAAAVAAGFGPVAVGADGGGSIRIPASLCGLVGLKPTYGRVSERGAAPLCWSVAHIGPIAATARDAAVAYALMAAPDGDDPHAKAMPEVDLDGVGDSDLEGMCFGIYRTWFEDADPQVVAACERMLGRLVERGARVEEVEIEGLNTIRVAHLVTIVGEMTASQLVHASHGREYGLDTRMNLALGRALTAADYVHAQRHRGETCRQIASLLDRVDAIVTPATACVAEPISRGALSGGESNLTLLGRIMRFAPAANLTGHPAITFPAGYTEAGMPVGLHLLGRAWQEHRLLKVAHMAESLLERREPRWYRRLLP